MNKLSPILQKLTSPAWSSSQLEYLKAAIIQSSVKSKEIKLSDRDSQIESYVKCTK